MILVDSIVDWGDHAKNKGLRNTKWCHMVSDTSHEELHAFAAKIGLKKQWFQGDHYDLTPTRRHLAVRLGAVEVTSRELVIRRIRREQIAPRESS